MYKCTSVHLYIYILVHLYIAVKQEKGGGVHLYTYTFVHLYICINNHTHSNKKKALVLERKRHLQHHSSTLHDYTYLQGKISQGGFFQETTSLKTSACVFSFSFSNSSNNENLDPLSQRSCYLETTA